MTRSVTRGSARRGFTLLELILALGISIGLLAAVVLSIDLQFRAIEAGRIDVEQAQLARTVLRRISEDLRCTLVHSPAQTTGLDELLGAAGLSSADPSTLESLAGAAGSGAAADALAGGVGLDGNSEDAAAAAESAAAELEGQSADTLTENLTPRDKPGIYGNASTLQIDVSRLPRLDQYTSVVVDGQRSRASDVKTVAYFVVPSETNAATNTAAVMTSSRPGGLYRREIDRSVGLMSSAEGQITTLDDKAQPLAPEISAIQFQYHDGTDWVAAWDSGEKGAPPLAVEVIVTVRSPPRSTSIVSQTVGNWGVDPTQPIETPYRYLVHIPGASRAALEAAKTAADLEAEAAKAESGASGSSSSSSGSSPLGGSGSSGAGGAGGGAAGGTR